MSIQGSRFSRDEGSDFCCEPQTGSIRKGNTRLVFATPVQVQTGCAGSFCGSSQDTSVQTPDVLPYVFGFPSPDPKGLQGLFMFQQTEASFSELGVRGEFLFGYCFVCLFVCLFFFFWIC
jgi:hypothetical protein